VQSNIVRILLVYIDIIHRLSEYQSLVWKAIDKFSWPTHQSRWQYKMFLSYFGYKISDIFTCYSSSVDFMGKCKCQFSVYWFVQLLYCRINCFYCIIEQINICMFTKIHLTQFSCTSSLFEVTVFFVIIVKRCLHSIGQHIDSMQTTPPVRETVSPGTVCTYSGWGGTTFNQASQLVMSLMCSMFVNTVWCSVRNSNSVHVGLCETVSCRTVFTHSMSLDV